MSLRACMRFVLGTVVLIGAGALAPALAGQEKVCTKQYSIEEHQILQWAALGGDPHAQYALAQCSMPRGKSEFTDAERAYAVKWVSLAACDVEGNPHVADRDRLLRRLRSNGDISFRRFSGEQKHEKWSKREKRFKEYRKAKNQELMARYERLGEIVNDADRLAGQDLLIDDLARFGPLGLSRLTTLAKCPYFNDSASFTVASYRAAAEVWSRPEIAEEYGLTTDEAEAKVTEAETMLQELSNAQRLAAMMETDRLMTTDPVRVAGLEEKAALGQLKDLTLVSALPSVGLSAAAIEHVGFENVSAEAVAVPSVTVAAQYALEAMGFMEFTNGPDNDYGPSTIDAVGKAQAAYGRAQTRWLSHEEVRQLVCDASVDAADPVSSYHLGVMFAEGWGFPVDLVKARYAITKADREMAAALDDFDDLDEWKQRAYPVIQAEIERTRTKINSAWTVTPEPLKVSWAGRLSDETFCQ
ncbi:MAG: hypothetical protein AAFY84_12410 [Pseudomonadota bacterium]